MYPGRVGGRARSSRAQHHAGHAAPAAATVTARTVRPPACAWWAGSRASAPGRVQHHGQRQEGRATHRSENHHARSARSRRVVDVAGDRLRVRSRLGWGVMNWRRSRKIQPSRGPPMNSNCSVPVGLALRDGGLHRHDGVFPFAAP